MGIFDGFFRGTGPDDPAVAAFRRPATRPQLFLVAFWENRGKLVLLNLLYLLLCVPAIVWCALQLMQVESLLRQMPEDFMQQVLRTVYMLVLGMLLCGVLLGLANTGIARVSRSWARDEYAFVCQDFFGAIRENWKQGATLSLFSSMWLLILYWYMAFLVTNPARVSSSVFPLAVCAVAFFLWCMMLPTMYVMLVSYELPLRAVLKNALFMTLAHLPSAIGIFLVSLLPGVIFVLILLYVSLQLGTILLAIYLLAWGASLPWLLYSAFANRLCEEFINPKIGAPVRIGLREDEKS